MKLIFDNANKKLSRSKKRRNERGDRMNDDMKLFLKKIKSEMRKRNKNLDKIKQIEIPLVNIKYAYDPNELQSALKKNK